MKVLSWWFSRRGPPVPIPNTEVKPPRADGTFFEGRVGRRQLKVFNEVRFFLREVDVRKHGMLSTNVKSSIHCDFLQFLYTQKSPTHARGFSFTCYNSVMHQDILYMALGGALVGAAFLFMMV